jgi:diphosphomevalonate decarboxylase
MIFAEAPSNIALIKYMGKGAGNQPLNPSLSLTLPNFRSRVEIHPQGAEDQYQDQWRPLEVPPWKSPSLSDKGVEKFLRHFGLLKKELGLPGHFQIRSGNNFPGDCGVASSAASFAALTLAAYRLSGKDLPLARVAELSRQGSGSSCRSVGPDWMLWDDTGAREWPHGAKTQHGSTNLRHELVLIDAQKKEVTSSEAHRRVLTSAQFPGRPERARNRLRAFEVAWGTGDWTTCRQVVWDEFQDMHALFSTSNPPFSYLTKPVIEFLALLQREYETHGDGPMVTLDAGPNVHLLYRADQSSIKDLILERWPHWTVLVGREKT